MPSVYARSLNIAQIKESATLAVAARAKALRAEGRPILDLGAGEPDSDTPAFIRRAAQRAIDRGHTRYTATEGILPLREAIAARATEHCRAHSGADVGASEVIVSTGSKQALFNACFVLFGAGDEVLVPTPAWTSYYEMIALARATPVPVMGDAGDGFKVDVAMLERAATPRTKGLLLNSPCNPTGAVYTARELRALLELAAARGWWVISDEIYTRLVYGAEAATALAISEDRQRLIVVDGVAKAYAMTGWRIGWAIAPRAVVQAMGALQSHTTSNASSISQHAALAALSERALADEFIGEMLSRFRARRALALAILSGAPELPVIQPDGAFYLYVNVLAAAKGIGATDDVGARVAEYLLEKYDVAVVPGSAFLTPDWVRISYAAPDDHVAEGVERLVRACRERC